VISPASNARDLNGRGRIFLFQPLPQADMNCGTAQVGPVAGN